MKIQNPSSHIVSALLLTMACLFPSVTFAGGVSLGATRVIYPMDAKQASLAVINNDKNNRFLIQSWVEDENGQKSDDFILTPPLFVSKPQGENTLRIMYAGKALPTDKETAYWLNSKAIPSVSREDIQDKNVLQVAILSRIKLFVRPEGLPTPSSEAPEQLSFSHQGKNLLITNPSPYYVSMVNISADGKTLPGTMVPPKGNISIPLPSEKITSITYQAINDYGAMTPRITKPLK